MPVMISQADLGASVDGTGMVAVKQLDATMNKLGFRKSPPDVFELKVKGGAVRIGDSLNFSGERACMRGKNRAK